MYSIVGFGLVLQVERLEDELQQAKRRQETMSRQHAQELLASPSRAPPSSETTTMKALVRREQELTDVIERQGQRLRRRPSWSFFFMWIFLASMGCCIYGYIYGIQSGHGTRFCAVDAYRQTF